MSYLSYQLHIMQTLGVIWCRDPFLDPFIQLQTYQKIVVVMAVVVIVVVL